MATTAARFEGHFDVFAPTAEEILRFVETTRPTPPVEDVEAHIAWLDRRGLIPDPALDALRRHGYRV